MKNTKYALSFLTVLTVFSFTSNTYAVEQDIGARAEFKSALALANTVDMDFGTIIYTSSAAGTTITLSSADSSLSSSDDTNYSTQTNGTPGSLDITGTIGQTVEISCEASGTVSDGTNSFDLNNVTINLGGGNTTCAGLGTSPLNYTMNATNELKMGADLVIGAGGVVASGIYNTSNAGGNPITVRVVYQ